MTSRASSSIMDQAQRAFLVARLDGFAALTLAYRAATLVRLEPVSAHPLARYPRAIDGLVGPGRDEISVGFLPVHSFSPVYHLRLNGHLQVAEILVGNLAALAQLSPAGIHCPPVETLQVAVIYHTHTHTKSHTLIFCQYNSNGKKEENNLPSQTGQHSPGTLRGWRHGVRQKEAWHLDWPSRQMQVVQSSSIQVSLSDIFLPDGLTQP